MSILILLFSLLCFGQEKTYQYQMDGTYSATLPGLSDKKNIHFILFWTEKKGNIDGVYKDDFFTTSSPVSGTTGATGKVFTVTLPRVIQNVRKLSLTANIENLEGGTLPVMIFMKDMVEMTVDQVNILATVWTKSNYIPEQETCDVGFDVLKGYCGLYKGSLNKLRDTANLCNLPDYGFKFELNQDAKFNLYFYYSDSLIGIPNHSLGTFSTLPLSPAINLSERHCGYLAGTTFPSTSCQKLSLTGNFSKNGEERNFRGRYTITDEKNNDECSYEIVMVREKEY